MWYIFLHSLLFATMKKSPCTHINLLFPIFEVIIFSFEIYQTTTTQPNEREKKLQDMNEKRKKTTTEIRQRKVTP